MAKSETNVTVYGRLSFPVWTRAEAIVKAAKNTQFTTPEDQVTAEFNLILEESQLDKFKNHVRNVFLPYVLERGKAGEKSNALDQTQVNRILKVLDSDFTEQPPYIPLKPVPEKTKALAPEGLAMLKVKGPRGADIKLAAIVHDEDELRVPDPALIAFPVVRPQHTTVHELYPGAQVAATLNLYAFLSGKVPGFSASASTAIFKADAERFGGGVDVDVDDLFLDD